MIEDRRWEGLPSSLTAIPRREKVRRWASRADPERGALPDLHDALSPQVMRRRYPLAWLPNLIHKILFGSSRGSFLNPKRNFLNPKRKLPESGMTEPFRRRRRNGSPFTAGGASTKGLQNPEAVAAKAAHLVFHIPHPAHGSMGARAVHPFSSTCLWQNEGLGVGQVATMEDDGPATCPGSVSWGGGRSARDRRQGLERLS